MTINSPRKGILQTLGFPHHEYWSWWLLVIPIWPLWLWYGLRLRCATWFTAVNPSMEDSGFVGESKIKILDSIPQNYKPLTLFIAHNKELNSFLKQSHFLQFQFPIIAKPDIGGRGRKVEILQSIKELENYHKTVAEDYIIQEIIRHELELGIFYTRLPNEEKGKVISIAIKNFLQVVGNGIHTIEQLMAKNYRTSLQIERLSKVMDLRIIPQCNTTILLDPIGNHCRGTTFINGNYLINEKLNDTFDIISKQITGFYYGRYDLKVKSIEDLYAGYTIKILELNGLTADAAHIFDPNTRLRDAYKTQIKHCKISYEIAKQNLKLGVKTTPVLTLIRKCLNHIP